VVVVVAVHVLRDFLLEIQLVIMSNMSLWYSGINTTIACWADWLMALAGLGSNAGLDGSFTAQLG